MRGAWRAARAVRMASALASIVGCAATGGGSPSLPRHGPAPAWRYDVTASPGATDLEVVATFPPHSDRKMVVVDHAEVFLVGVQVEDGSNWREVRRVGSVWDIDSCPRGCRVRYRYLLADAAAALSDAALARREDGVILAPPSTWLLRPEHGPSGTALRFHVTTAPGDAFVTGVFAAPGEPASSGTFEAQVGDLLQLPYSAFGPLRIHDIASGTATLALLPGALPEADVVAWAEASLDAVRGFYGRPTVPHVLLLVRPAGGDGVGFGSTMGYSGAAIVVNVGSQTTKDAFRRDWVLVHELVHTAFPDVPEEQHWLEEGLATYVEPLARHRQGALSSADVWREWAARMKQGEPEAGDQGLDRTHTWGRTYWGGALFCLVADVEIRARTQGKASLETVLRAVLAEGANIAVAWPIERLLAVADRATGTTVLRETYDMLARHSTPVDLTTLWKRLGVAPGEGDDARFDDGAELAWVRRAITPPR